MTDFARWLDSELKKRRWTKADLARASELSQTAIGQVFSDKRKPGPDLCNAIAGALDLPPETVFRKAGLLPELPEDDEKFLSETIEAFKRLTIEQRQIALENMLAQLRRQRRKKDRQELEEIENEIFSDAEGRNEGDQDSGLVPG